MTHLARNVSSLLTLSNRKEDLCFLRDRFFSTSFWMYPQNWKNTEPNNCRKTATASFPAATSNFYLQRSSPDSTVWITGYLSQYNRSRKDSAHLFPNPFHYKPGQNWHLSPSWEWFITVRNVQEGRLQLSTDVLHFKNSGLLLQASKSQWSQERTAPLHTAAVAENLSAVS